MQRAAITLAAFVLASTAVSSLRADHNWNRHGRYSVGRPPTVRHHSHHGSYGSYHGYGHGGALVPRHPAVIYPYYGYPPIHHGGYYSRGPGFGIQYYGRGIGFSIRF